MKTGNIAIHIEAEHTCGHMHKTILYVKDAKLEGSVNMYYSPFEPIRRDKFASQTEIKTENKIELTGILAGIESATCICHLSRKARWRWITRLLGRYSVRKQA